MRWLYALLAGLVLPTASEAQSRADTTAVLLSAWDRLVGSTPFRHPQGTTSFACLTSGRMGTPPRFGDLSPAVRDELLEVLAERRSVRWTTGCGVNLADPTADPHPMLDAQGRPAIDVQLFHFVFDAAARAEVGLHVAAGGRWGSGDRCILERRPDATWSVVTCRRVVDR